MARALSLTAVTVLQALAGGSRYGFDIIDRTGLPSGTVYPALSRFERDGFVRSTWENAEAARDDKRPPRRYYQLTPQGRRALGAALERLRAIGGMAARPAAARARNG
jgi:PadR family transcriptional regulator, regulatory protein PadR